MYIHNKNIIEWQKRWDYIFLAIFEFCEKILRAVTTKLWSLNHSGYCMLLSIFFTKSHDYNINMSTKPITPSPRYLMVCQVNLISMMTDAETNEFYIFYLNNDRIFIKRFLLHNILVNITGLGNRQSVHISPFQKGYYI